MAIFCEAIALMSPAVHYLKKITYSFRLLCKIKREKIVKILKKTAQKQKSLGGELFNREGRKIITISIYYWKLIETADNKLDNSVLFEKVCTSCFPMNFNTTRLIVLILCSSASGAIKRIWSFDLFTNPQGQKKKTVYRRMHIYFGR